MTNVFDLFDPACPLRVPRPEGDVRAAIRQAMTAACPKWRLR